MSSRRKWNRFPYIDFVLLMMICQFSKRSSRPEFTKPNEGEWMLITQGVVDYVLTTHVVGDVLVCPLRAEEEC